MLSFDEAWEIASKIKGWFTRVEAHALYGHALIAPKGGALVEIGCYRGRSLTMLAATGKPTIGIDPLSTDASIDITEGDAEQLLANVRRFDNAKWVREDSAAPEARKDLGKIGLLHIDGMHEDGAPWTDFLVMRDNLMKGAFVCWHDFRKSGAAIAKHVQNGIVKERVKLVQLEQDESLAVFRYDGMMR